MPDDTRPVYLAAKSSFAVIRGIVFIDARVPDLQDLIDGVKPGELVFVLDPGSDGLDQIAKILAAGGYTDLTSISIVGHGAAGELSLGSATIAVTDLASHSGDLSVIGSALTPGGDLQLLGRSPTGFSNQMISGSSAVSS